MIYSDIYNILSSVYLDDFVQRVTDVRTAISVGWPVVEDESWAPSSIGFLPAIERVVIEESPDRRLPLQRPRHRKRHFRLRHFYRIFQRGRFLLLLGRFGRRRLPSYALLLLLSLVWQEERGCFVDTGKIPLSHG